MISRSATPFPQVIMERAVWQTNNLRHRVLYLIGFLLCVGLAKGQVANQLPNLKLIENDHFRLFFTGEVRDTAPLVLEEGEQVLADLAARWALILPETPFGMSLSRENDPKGSHLDTTGHLSVEYRPEARRIDIRLKNPRDYDDALLRRNLEHALIHALLDQTEQSNIPPFIAEGIARYYAGNLGSRDTFLAILAFQQVPKTRTLLENTNWTRQPNGYLSKGSLAKLFFQHLRSSEGGSEAAFVQGLLQGQSWEEALTSAGYPDANSMLSSFDSLYRPQFRLSAIIWTRDFWLILLGTLAQLFLIYHLVLAVKTARMGVLEIAAPAEQVDASEFTGPIFGSIPNGPAFFETPAAASKQDTAPPPRNMRPAPPNPAPPHSARPARPLPPSQSQTTATTTWKPTPPATPQNPPIPSGRAIPNPAAAEKPVPIRPPAGRSLPPLGAGLPPRPTKDASPKPTATSEVPFSDALDDLSFEFDDAFDQLMNDPKNNDPRSR